MRRRVVKLASVLSLILCAAVFFLGAFGYNVGNRFDIGTDSSHFTMLSSCGTIRVHILLMKPNGFWVIDGAGIHHQFVLPEEGVVASLYRIGFHRRTFRGEEDVDAQMPCWLAFALLLAAHRLFIWLGRTRDPDPVPYCSTCAYNLTGNTSGVCPECGTPVHPKAESTA